MDVKEKLKNLPSNPGVYLMKDSRNEVIYVGKAKNLQNRVRSYFQKTGDGRALVGHLVPLVSDIDCVITDTEKEALILENNLIKQFKPRFNVNFCDDKTYVSVKIDMTKKFPYPEVVREVKKDGALYFGPYSSARAVRETLRYINSIYPIRKCSESTFHGRKRPCLYHQIGKCLGPCCDLVDEKAYKEMLQEVILVLKGKNEELIRVLKEKMKQEADAKRYEKAAQIRDRINAITETIEKQKIRSLTFIDRDVFGYYKEGKDVLIEAMFIRSGNLENVASYNFSTGYNTAEEIFCAFLNQFYSYTRFIPKEVIIPVETEDAQLLEGWLSDLKGEKVSVIFPRRGDKLSLVKLAQKNAENAFRARFITKEDHQQALNSLKERLQLTNIPERIECFDISNIRGKLAVGSMVTFKNGVPDKSGYKRFKIKTVLQSDDYAMMEEVLTRRYTKAIKDDDLPDLTVVDGGKGQLGIATKVFRELGVEGVDIVALAKGRNQKDGRGVLQYAPTNSERIYTTNKAEPIVLPLDSSELLLLDRIRDEAHRFAISYHKKLRQRQYYVSPLDKIPGIGAVRKKSLMRHFGNIENIRQASVEQLKEAKHISEKQATLIYNYFHSPLTLILSPKGRG
ncbi:MAG TPA: excinuclease ABC subunit UvrC [Candidatus Brocadiia bacterium]|nr:excinuclease ABC subunit UvrC [Candidatus Brocadiales bacterium]